MGYYTADGFYMYEEADAADPGAGFSDLLNKAMVALPAAIRSRVIAELNADPTIRDAVEAAVLDFVEGLNLVLAVKCVHLEGNTVVWDGPDSPAATHYLIPDHTGMPVPRATPFPIPSASSPQLTW